MTNNNGWKFEIVTYISVVDDDSESSLRLSEANDFDSDSRGSTSGQLHESIDHLIGTSKHL